MKKESKPRILYIIQLPPPVHGVSVINEIIYKSEKINEGFDRKIIQIRFSKDFKNIRRLSPRKLFTLIKLSVDLIKMVFSFRPELIYFSFMPVGIGFIRDSFFAFILKSSRKPIIFHLHNRGIHKYIENPVFKYLYERTFNNSYVIHLSRKLLEEEILPYSFSNIKTFEVANTIPEGFYKGNLEKVKNQKILILFLSNYLQQKGLMELLEAILMLINIYPNKEIIVNTYGATYKSNYINKCKLFLIKHQLSDIVTISGPVYNGEKRRIFSCADIFVFPSYFEEECFPLSILEAMNAKLPIIATRIGAIPEMIEDNLEGLIVEPKRPDLIFEKLKFLIENKDLRKKLGNNAYNKFKINYSLPVFEEKMKYVFKSVLANPKS